MLGACTFIEPVPVGPGDTVMSEDAALGSIIACAFTVESGVSVAGSVIDGFGDGLGSAIAFALAAARELMLCCMRTAGRS